MKTSRTKSVNSVHTLALTAFLAASFHSLPLGAQDLNDEEAIDRIIGSEVREEQVQSAAGDDRVITAMDKSGENTEIVRKVTNLERVDIVFLPGASAVEGGPPPKIAAKLSENSETVKSLRRELEANALLYHALNSRNVLIDDILAIEFDGDKRVTVFAAAKPSP